MSVVSCAGDHTSHTGSLITANQNKLFVSGKRVTIANAPSPDTLTVPNPAIHLASRTTNIPHKLTVAGIHVNTIGDLCTCSSTIVGPGGLKLIVA